MVAAAGTFTPTVGYVFEMSHPLNSGDSAGGDYALSIGSTVGWCFAYNDFAFFGGFVLAYPLNCIIFTAGRFVGNSNFFGNIAKAAQPAPQPPKSVGGEMLFVNVDEILTP
jgi:hypothetical protein